METVFFQLPKPIKFAMGAMESISGRYCKL